MTISRIQVASVVLERLMLPAGFRLVAVSTVEDGIIQLFVEAKETLPVELKPIYKTRVTTRANLPEQMNRVTMHFEHDPTTEHDVGMFPIMDIT